MTNTPNYMDDSLGEFSPVDDVDLISTPSGHMLMNEPLTFGALYCNAFQSTWKTQLAFETKSRLGRWFLSRKPPQQDVREQFLHLGCGTKIWEGWVSADFFVGRYWRLPKSFWMLDLRYPLQCDGDYWNGIFSEHTLEHLYPAEVRNLLGEMLRTLKPASWLRISVPDLEKYVSFYTNKQGHAEFSQWATGAEAIRSLTQDWGHRSLWDSELLKRTVSEAGFVNVREVGFMEGTDERLCKESRSRRWESLYLEAQKP